MPEPGEDARTREMVGQSIRAVRAQVLRGTNPGAGHAVDARMDSIASQAALSGGGNLLDAKVRSDVSAVRDNLDHNHRREMQLAAMGRAAAHALKEPKSAIGTGVTVGTRTQATSGASRAPTVAARTQEPATRGMPMATVNRSVRVAPQKQAAAPAAKIEPIRKPMRSLEHGGHPDVPMPAPRPPGPGAENHPAKSLSQSRGR